VLTPLIYLGGVFYSVSLLPPWAEKLSYVNPILYMVNAFRHGFLGASDVDPGHALLIMAAFAAVMYTLVVVLMNRGTGIRD
jgi:ABC-2 type transport system permease protein